MIFCIFTQIPFSVNNSYFHFEGRSSIGILQFKFPNQTICHFSEIFVEFSVANVECNY